MRTDDLRRAILLLLRNSELYGYDINRRLSQQKTNINISRLYGILNEMQKDRLLQARWERSEEGPRKKMYSLTEQGKKALNEILLDSISTVHMFYGDYLRSLYPKVDVFGNIITLLTNELQEDASVAYHSTNFSGIDQILVRSIHQKNPQGKMYLIKPSTLDFSTNLENVSVFDGTHVDLSFKDDMFDQLIVVGVPSQETLMESVKEWRRVINERGRLIIITPSILVQEHNDPMTIGDFVEMHEHQFVEKGSHILPDFFIASLKSQFSNVNISEAVHLTYVIAKNT